MLRLPVNLDRRVSLPMNFNRLLISFAVTVALIIALYLLIAYPLLRDPEPETRVAASSVPAAPPFQSQPKPGGEVKVVSKTGEVVSPMQSELPGGRKLLEIFGHVVDLDGKPIENVLISEERYFTATRSGDDGRYRILLDLPRYRYPVLHFLRSGYDGKRIKLGKNELEHNPVYKLDLTLENALNSVTLQGWVGNDNGLGLEGARVELAASYSRNTDSFYLTVFTDAQGNFSFEGVRSGETYKLSVNLTPEYPYYEDPEFFVMQNPGLINIELKTLKFVDIDGMIVDRAQAPVPDYEIYVTNLTTGIHTRKIVSDSSGFFSLQHFPLGEISLSTRGAEFYKISGLVLSDERYQNLELIVDRGDHYLSGWVSTSNGIAVEKAMVTLDRKFTRNGIEHTSYRSQGTDPAGGFSFANLAGGEHHVTVYAWGYAKQEFMHRFNAQADELHIQLIPLE